MYLSPEMVKETGYNHTTDWWGLGIVTFELITGLVPFPAKEKNKLYTYIVEAEVPFQAFEKHGLKVPLVAQDLIKRLLDNDPKYRLGKNGVNEIL